jgi:beta-lactamase superfamily II metal-dependent hydrolase
MCLFANAYSSDPAMDEASDSSDSADRQPLSDGYPKSRLSPFYDINPFAYDLQPYTAGDLLESSWRLMFGDIDGLFSSISRLISEDDGTVLQNMFQRAVEILEESGEPGRPGEQLEDCAMGIARKIREEVGKKSQKVLFPTSREFFNFLGIVDGQDFAIKACRQCFPVQELQEFYNMVHGLSESGMEVLLSCTLDHRDMELATPDPQSVDKDDVHSWGPFYAQCLRNIGEIDVRQRFTSCTDSQDFTIRVCQAQHLVDFYEKMAKLSGEDFQKLLQAAAAGMNSIEGPSIPDSGDDVQRLAQCLYNVFYGEDQSRKRIDDLMSISPIARGLRIRGEHIEGIQCEDQLNASFYQRYYKPFLTVDERLARVGLPRCQSGEFLERFVTGRNPNSSELHVFSFNVGQANCIILRHGTESVIIDAGKGNGLSKGNFEKFIQPKMFSLLHGTQLKAIFVTHPHTDHYNLIPDLLRFGVDSEGCKVFLGGEKSAWETSRGELGTFWGSIRSYQVFFITDRVCNVDGVSCPQFYQDIFDGVAFQFILPLNRWRRADNACSFFLKVCHRDPGRSFLFTGDAEGRNLDEITGHVYKEGHAELLHRAIAPEFKSCITPPPRQQVGMSVYKENRRALQDVGVVFVPHHGAGTDGSQNVMTYLLGLEKPPAAFVVNSVVTTRDGNPSASTIRMVNKPWKHDPHAVTFSKNGNVDYKFTTRRIYNTEAAPGGLYWFMSNGDGIGLYNAYQNESYADIGFERIK